MMRECIACAWCSARLELEAALTSIPRRNLRRARGFIAQLQLLKSLPEKSMTRWKWLAVATISVLSLTACARQESAAEAQKQADAAAIKGSEQVMEAKRDAATAEIKASEDVAKSEDKAVAQVDSAQAAALQKTGNAEVKVSLAQAQSDYDVAVAKCRALAGADQKNCKNQAQADFDAAKAQASVTRQDIKSEAQELKN
jgi:hypothetical protein